MVGFGVPVFAPATCGSAAVVEPWAFALAQQWDIWIEHRLRERCSGRWLTFGGCRDAAWAGRRRLTREEEERRAVVQEPKASAESQDAKEGGRPPCCQWPRCRARGKGKPASGERAAGACWRGMPTSALAALANHPPHAGRRAARCRWRHRRVGVTAADVLHPLAPAVCQPSCPCAVVDRTWTSQWSTCRQNCRTCRS